VSAAVLCKMLRNKIGLSGNIEMWMFLEVHIRIHTFTHKRTHAQVFIDEIDAVGRARGRGGAGVCARD